MKRQHIAGILLFLFSLTNAGVVVGAHTCLKSNQTEFSLFPTAHLGGCCENKVNDGPSHALRNSEGGKDWSSATAVESASCSPSFGITGPGSACCSPAKACAEVKNIQCNADQVAPFQLEGHDCSVFNSSGCISFCAKESCCRIDQVALLDLHVRTLPEKFSIGGWVIGEPIGMLFIFPGLFSAQTIKMGHVGKSPPSKISPSASRLQVWRL